METTLSNVEKWKLALDTNFYLPENGAYGWHSWNDVLSDKKGRVALVVCGASSIKGCLLESGVNYYWIGIGQTLGSNQPLSKERFKLF